MSNSGNKENNVSAAKSAVHANGEYLVLQQIGMQLDNNIFPRIKNGGIVVPSEPAVFPTKLGKETGHVKSREKRSKIRPRARSSGMPRTTGRSWSPRKATPVICPDLRAKYQQEVAIIREAYPNTRTWHQTEGLWLLTESSLLAGLHKSATFLTGISFTGTGIMNIRSWGFWGGLLGDSVWIGPRHTNFPDGSVCAFEPTDYTWVIGDSIVELLDLYTLWAVRHLHLQIFGRWPGYQAIHHPYERILELREDEFCGCGELGKLYGECCQHADLSRDRVADAVRFNMFTGGGREPPESVVRFVRERKAPPCLHTILAA